jgi:hypothetical protein
MTSTWETLQSFGQWRRGTAARIRRYHRLKLNFTWLIGWWTMIWASMQAFRAPSR